MTGVSAISGIAALSDEFIAVHRRHQNVRDDQFRVLGLAHGESFRAVAGLEQAVTGITKEGHQKFPVTRTIVNYEDGRHVSPSPSPPASLDLGQE